MTGRELAIMPRNHLTQVNTKVLELTDRIEQAGQFVAIRKNQDGSVTLVPGEVTQLLMLLGA